MALGCPRRAVAGRFAAALPVLTLAAVLLSGCTPVPPAALAAKAPSAGPFRRVVTGLDALGRSAVIEDGPVPEAFRMSAATLPPEAIAAKPYLRYILETDPIWAGTLPVDNGSAPDVAGAPRSGPDDGLVPKLPGAGFVAVMFRWAPGGAVLSDARFPDVRPRGRRLRRRGAPARGGLHRAAPRRRRRPARHAPHLEGRERRALRDVRDPARRDGEGGAGTGAEVGAASRDTGVVVQPVGRPPPRPTPMDTAALSPPAAARPRTAPSSRPRAGAPPP